MTADDARAAIARVLAEIAPEADLATVAPGDDLRTTLDLDSVDFLNLVVGLHRVLGIDVPERDYPQLATLERAIAYLAARGGPLTPPRTA